MITRTILRTLTWRDDTIDVRIELRPDGMFHGLKGWDSGWTREKLVAARDLLNAALDESATPTVPS